MTRTQHIHNLLKTGSYTICELQTHVTKKMNRSRRWSVSAIQTSINEIPNAVKDGASSTIVPLPTQSDPTTSATSRAYSEQQTARHSVCMFGRLTVSILQCRMMGLKEGKQKTLKRRVRGEVVSALGVATMHTKAK